MAAALSVTVLVLKTVLGVLCGLLILLSIIGGIGYVFRLGAAPSYEMVTVQGDRRLHCMCEGPEYAPLVLYDAGAFGIYTDGWWILKALSTDHRVCLYDRAGMGWSDPVPEGVTPDPDWHVEDMRRLRNALGYQAPFILVGHSMAGLRLHAYANAYPDDLVGLVFVDAVRPQSLVVERVDAFVPWMNVGLTLSGLFARIGIAGGAAALLPDELKLSSAPAKDKRRSIAAVRHHKATKAELSAALQAWPGASWESETGANQLPVFVFSNAEGGGANAPVARAAQEATGLGGVTALPGETHVSLLNQENAKLIARDVRKLTRSLTDD
ncbi:MAG: alpha/beta fold hydrolase [Pseudomonadota bacterium]